MEKRERSGALWLKTDKNGKKYMTGVFAKEKIPPNGAEVRITIFKNNYKEKETQPDYVIYLDEAQPRRSDPKPQAEQEMDSDAPF